MSDRDRALIDKFIAEHGVTKVPRGATGLLDEDGKLKPDAFKWGGARKRGRPRKAQPSQPEPASGVPARRANTERFAAAIDAEPARPDKAEAREKPQEPRAASSPVQAPEEAPSKAGVPSGRSRLKHDDDIRFMAENGWTVRMIADALGMALGGVRKACDRLGVEPRNDKRRKGSPERDERIKALCVEGHTINEIAADLGTSYQSIHASCRRLGVKPKRDTTRKPAKDDTIRALVEQGKTAREIAETTGYDKSHINYRCRVMGIRPGQASRPAFEIHEARRAEYMELQARGLSAGEMARDLGVTREAVYSMLKRLGLRPVDKQKAPPHKAPSAQQPGWNDAASVKKRERAADASEKITDRRRFRTASVPMGEPAVQLASDHEAVAEGRTYFPSRVFDASADDRVLIDGCNNSKIGGDVLVGWLKGARIVTLTLEERATCPRDCPIYRGCYGNAMQWARRWRHGPALERRIAAEVRQLCKAHERVLVRLHILGDFYSVQYVEFWRDLLVEHPGLYVFGFTAWGEDTEIGAYVAAVRHAFPRRWWVRHSGRTGPWGSFTIDFPTSKKRIGDALVCPEQRDAMNGGAESRHCGNCAACWSSSVPIVFVEH